MSNFVSSPIMLRAAVPVVIALYIASTMLARTAAAQADEGSSEAAGATADQDAELQQLLAVPDGTMEELIEYLTTLVRATPGDRSPAEARTFLRQTSRTLVETADRLQTLEPSDKQAALAFQVKVLGLQRLARLGEPKTAESLDALVKQLRRDPREAVAVVGWQSFIMSHFQEWQTLDDQAKQRFQDEIVSAAGESGATQLHVELVQVVAQQTERADVEFAKTLLNRAMPIFVASKDQGVLEAAQRSIGMTRRLNLPGNKMELTGTLLDGSQFDWEAYRGKVVLVDFWATWCGPCIMELPNVRAMYQAYHDRGFDVVGISLDESQAKTESFIEENGVTWATLFPQDPQQRKWSNPIAQYYGITGIPTAILVDGQGRAIEMNARGEALRAKLAELLGPPDEESARFSTQLPSDANAER